MLQRQGRRELSIVIVLRLAEAGGTVLSHETVKPAR
jgi:hypothetical protein